MKLLVAVLLGCVASVALAAPRPSGLLVIEDDPLADVADEEVSFEERDDEVDVYGLKAAREQEDSAFAGSDLVESRGRTARMLHERVMPDLPDRRGTYMPPRGWPKRPIPYVLY